MYILSEPQVFLVGETRIVEDGLQSYLDSIKPDWDTDAPTDAEKLVEAMGRLCYRSWAPGLNPNVTRVREGNKLYIEHILASGHGSVLEHINFNFIFKDVSRVFTHELVRHRAGVAISQESLRFVRLTDIGILAPDLWIREDREAMEIVMVAIGAIEEAENKLAEHFGVNDALTFAYKKEVTSFMRRIAPEGLPTTIGWSANARALRWIIESRTSDQAEKEIRVVFGKVAKIVTQRYPNLFGDFEPHGDEPYVWRPTYHKV